MNTRRRGDFPADLAQVGRRFEHSRRSRKARSRIPEPLWAAAVKMADRHGINRTARALRVDYYSLKKRIERKRPPHSSLVQGPRHGGFLRKDAAATFIELPPLVSATPANVLQVLANARWNGRRPAARNCGSIFRASRRPTWRRCAGVCGHDPTHASDADRGGGRAGGFPPGDRRSGAALPRRIKAGSVQRLGVRVPQPAGDGIERSWFTTAKVFGFATSGFLAGISPGGRPAKPRRPRRWRPISCRCCFRRAIPKRCRRPRHGGRSVPSIDAEILANCSLRISRLRAMVVSCGTDRWKEAGRWAKAWAVSLVAGYCFGYSDASETDHHRVGHERAGRHSPACRDGAFRKRLRLAQGGVRVLRLSFRFGGRQEHQPRSAAEDALRREDREDGGGARQAGIKILAFADRRISRRIARGNPGGKRLFRRLAQGPRPQRSRGLRGRREDRGAPPSLTPGDACPKCGEGTVYETGRPGVLVRFTGQAPLAGQGLLLAEAALQPLRRGLHGPAAGGRRFAEVRRDGREHDRAVEVRQWNAFQSPGGPARESGAFPCRPRPSGTSFTPRPNTPNRSSRS